MRDTLELAALLLLLVLGHNVVRGSGRILRDTASGFALWLGTMAAITVLMFRPLLLEVLVRIGIGIALAYVAFRLFAWVRDLFRPLPRLPAPSRRRMRRLLLAAGYPKAVRKEALDSLGDLINDRPALAAALLVSVCATSPPPEGPEEPGAIITGQLANHVRDADELLNAFRESSGGELPGDTDLVDGLILRHDIVVARKALKAARRDQRHSRLQRRWQAQLRNARTSSARAAALRQLGMEIPFTPDDGETAWKRLSRPEMLATFVFPLYAYIALKERRRAVLFGLCYALTAAYGSIALTRESDAGWVFLAVTGVLHISALIHLDAACGIDHSTPPSAVRDDGVGEESRRAAAQANP